MFQVSTDTVRFFSETVRFLRIGFTLQTLSASFPRQVAMRLFIGFYLSVLIFGMA